MTGGSAATDPLQPHPRARRFRPGGLALACAALLALAPRPAMAHATVLSSSPSPGERLQTAPGVVVLAFSEALNARLSRAIVIGPGSATFEQESVSESEVRITLTTNAPGVYEVRWTSVSAVDGHTLSGGYRFGVGVTPAPAGTPEEALPAGSDLALAAARAFEYAGLILAVGLLLLLRLARRGPRLPRRRAWIPAAIGISTAAGLAVVSGDWLIAAGTASPASLAAYLDSPIGWVPAARVAAEAVALLLALRWPEAASLPLAAALVALAATGHAAAVGRPFGGVAVAAVHLAAGGLWAGGILALALRRPPGGWPGPAGGRLLARFTPVALAAAALTAATGLLQAAGELGTFGDLVTSAYGRVLTAKALAVLVMIPLSFLAWRRRALLSRTLRVEAGLALTALAASGLLAAFPLPPARLQEAAAAAAGPSAALARPAPGDLTLAAAAGDTLVGLTLRPGCRCCPSWATRPRPGSRSPSSTAAGVSPPGAADPPAGWPT